MSSLQLWDAAKQSAKVISLPDGTAQIVASCHLASREPTSARWSSRPRASGTSSSGRRRRAAFYPRSTFQAVGLAFSPDASLVVAWDEAGKIGLWSLPETAPMAVLQSGDTPIRSVAFGLARGLAAPKTAAERWLLAAGDAGGTVTVWDLKKQVPINFCRGSFYDIYAVAFSPDGTTLASAGRYEAKLWDVATGRLLLSLGHRNTMTALAFSPDGTRLAVGSRTAYGVSGASMCTDSRKDVAFGPSAGCGDRSQRRSSLPTAGSSRDSHRIGKLRSGIGPPANFASLWMCPRACPPTTPAWPSVPTAGDSPSRPAIRRSCGTSTQARSWVPGRSPRAWWIRSPFPAANQLFLLRMETQDEKAAPDHRYPPREYPRVLRLRSLLGDRPTEPLRVITDFNWHVHHAAATPDGKYFVVEGARRSRGQHTHGQCLRCCHRGKLWSMPSRKKP